MKKILALLLLVTLCIPFCSAYAEDEVTNLTMWLFPLMADSAAEQALYDGLAAEFHEENPDITVEVNLLPWTNREQKMMTALAANKGPDIADVSPDIMRMFVSNGVLLPLDDYYNEDMQENLMSNFVEGVTVEDHIYGMPYYYDVKSRVYNLTMLEKIGMTEETLPTTFDEFTAMCQQLKEVGEYSVYHPFGASPINGNVYATLFSFGCEIISPEGEILLDSDEARAAFQWFVDLYQKGYSPEDSISTATVTDSAAFLSGEVASIILGNNGTFTKNAELWASTEFEWTVGPVLEGEGGAYAASSLGSLSITKDCENPEAAGKWLQFLARKENMSELCSNVGYFAPRTDVENLFPDDRGLSMVYQQASHGRLEIAHPASRQSNSLFIQNLQAMASGTKTIDQAIEDLTSGIQTIIDSLNALNPDVLSGY